MKSLIVALVAMSAINASASYVKVTACYGETNVCRTVLVKERAMGNAAQPAVVNTNVGGETGTGLHTGDTSIAPLKAVAKFFSAIGIEGSGVDFPGFEAP